MESSRAHQAEVMSSGETKAPRAKDEGGRGQRKLRIDTAHSGVAWPTREATCLAQRQRGGRQREGRGEAAPWAASQPWKKAEDKAELPE